MRFERFLVPEPAQTFLAARVFLRSVLSVYADLAPAAWRFETNPWGRPHIANREAPRELRFNLSHKPTQVTCLVGFERELGVDVEDGTANRPYLLEIASRFFSQSEAAALRALPPERHRERFYQLWTLKESYIKARGRGLSLGLSKFSFTPEGDTATVVFEEGFDDQPQNWDFRLFHPDPQHVIAATVEHVPGMPLIIESRDASRLVKEVLSES